MNTSTSTPTHIGSTVAVAETKGPPSVGSVSGAFGASRAPEAFSIEWAAGFADGEACIHIARQRYRGGRADGFRLRVYIVQNHLEVLEHFRNGVGIDAPIYKIKRTPGQNRQCYTLNYDGAKAMAVLTLLLPHLVRKRAEALAAWAFWVQGCVGLRPGRKGLSPAIRAIRQRFYLKLRSLK
jgi:hypothetical protein